MLMITIKSEKVEFSLRNELWLLTFEEGPRKMSLEQSKLKLLIDV